MQVVGAEQGPCLELGYGLADPSVDIDENLHLFPPADCPEVIGQISVRNIVIGNRKIAFHPPSFSP